jgi:hypothetical protein
VKRDYVQKKLPEKASRVTLPDVLNPTLADCRTNWTTCLDFHHVGHITKRRYKRMCRDATGFINSLTTKFLKRNEIKAVTQRIVKKEICAAVNLSKQAADLSENLLRKEEDL